MPETLSAAQMKRAEALSRKLVESRRVAAQPGVVQRAPGERSTVPLAQRILGRLRALQSSKGCTGSPSTPALSGRSVPELQGYMRCCTADVLAAVQQLLAEGLVKRGPDRWVPRARRHYPSYYAVGSA